MYSVYKITNKINNKSYIGSSINVKQRWRQHRTIMNQTNSSQYNYPLYCAFRKYGLENFIFDILKDDFDSYEEMINYEKDMIIFYDSVKNGYNQTYETNCVSNCIENLNKYQEKIQQKCALVDNNQNILHIYPSYHAAARANGEKEDQDWASQIRRVCKGASSNFQGKIFRDLDKNDNVIKRDIKRFHGRKKIIGISVEGLKDIYFNSISEAARITQIPRKSISECVNGSTRYTIVHNYIWRELDIFGDIIDNGINITDQIEKFNKSNPLIKGERHSISEWSKIYNLNSSTVRARLKKGKTIEEALELI